MYFPSTWQDHRRLLKRCCNFLASMGRPCQERKHPVKIRRAAWITSDFRTSQQRAAANAVTRATRRTVIEGRRLLWNIALRYISKKQPSHPHHNKWLSNLKDQTLAMHMTSSLQRYIDTHVSKSIIFVNLTIKSPRWFSYHTQSHTKTVTVWVKVTSLGISPRDALHLTNSWIMSLREYTHEIQSSCK